MERERESAKENEQLPVEETRDTQIVPVKEYEIFEDEPLRVETVENEKEELTAEEAKKNRKKEIWRVIKYTLFAASAGAIQIGTFTLLQLIPINVNETLRWLISYLPSLILSVIWNFTFNRKYTFKSANNVPIAMLKVAAYYAVFTPSSYFWGDALVKAGWNDFLVEAFNIIINFVTEFLYCRFFVFGKSIDTNNLAKKEQEKKEENEGEDVTLLPKNELEEVALAQEEDELPVQENETQDNTND